ncbi:hypothetical protein ACU6VG_19520 (plasmid) [Sphaerotilus sulfidivorans]
MRTAKRAVAGVLIAMRVSPVSVCLSVCLFFCREDRQIRARLSNTEKVRRDARRVCRQARALFRQSAFAMVQGPDGVMAPIEARQQA